MIRFTRDDPCPICGGYEKQERGQGKRCEGFWSDDREFAHCMRPELAHGIDQHAGTRAYPHWMAGPCKCGTSHGAFVAAATQEFEATYEYRDEHGTLLFQILRKPGKQFRQRQPDGAGGWIWGVKGVRPIIYKLYELSTDDTERPVYIVEGEKDVDTLTRKGFLATCNPNGAGKWPKVAASAFGPLTSRDVIIVADADVPGRNHALEVQANIKDYAHSVTLLECPKPHKDVSDLFSTGGQLDQLIPMQQQLTVPEKSDTPAPTNVPEEDIRTTIVWAAQLAQPLPPLNWLSEELTLAAGRPTVLAGEGGTRKGWFAMAMQVAGAGGKRLFGRFGFRLNLRSLYIDYEQGQRMTRERYQALCRGYELNFASLGIGYCWRPIPTLAPRADSDRIKVRDALCRLSESIDLVIVDSVRGCSPGVEENSVFASASLDIATDVSERTGATFVFLDHAGKPPKDPQENGRARKHAQRGHSSKLDAAQTLFVFSSSKGQPTLVTCERSQLVAEEKWPSDFQFTLLTTQGGLVLNDTQGPSPESEVAAQVVKECDRIASWIAAQGGKFAGSPSDLYEILRGNRSLFLQSVSKLKTSGRIQILGTRGKHEIVVVIQGAYAVDSANGTNGTGTVPNGTQVPSLNGTQYPPPYGGGTGTVRETTSPEEQAELDADEFYKRPEKEWKSYLDSKAWGPTRRRMARGTAEERVRRAYGDAETLYALFLKGMDPKAHVDEKGWPARRLEAAMWKLAEKGQKTPPPETGSDVRIKKEVAE